MNKRSARDKHLKKSQIFLRPKILTVFVLVLLTIFIFNQYRSSQFLTRNHRINLVINSNPVMMVSFSKYFQDKQIILVIPQNTYLPVAYGYGNYRIESLWQLSVLENNPLIFTGTLADALGLPMQFYIHRPGLPELKNAKDNSEILNFMKKYFSSVSWLSSANKTNLNFIDKLIIGFKILVLKSNDVLIYNLEEVPYLINHVTLPDSSSVNEFNQETLDTFLGQKFENRQIRTEGLTVEVQNTTSVSKIGQKFARYLINSGAKVIAITSSSEYISGCTVLTNKSNMKKSLIKFLVINFGCQVAENNDEQSIDVLIKLGENFSKRWSF